MEPTWLVTTSLKRLAKPISWLMANTVAEADLVTKLLLSLCKLSLQEDHNNSCLPNGLLIVNEDVKLVISKQRLKTDVGTKREAHIQPRISATKHDARIDELHVSAPKHEIHVQPQAVPKCKICVSL